MVATSKDGSTSCITVSFFHQKFVIFKCRYGGNIVLQMFSGSFVKPLKQGLHGSVKKTRKEDSPSPFPVNYRTCIDFYRGMRDIILTGGYTYLS